MSKKWIIVISVAAVAVLGLGIAAWAETGARGHKDGKGRAGMRGRVLFGQLTGASDTSWTIKPELPPKLKERLEAKAAEKGKELPALPESITVGVSPDSKFWLNGASASASDFKNGDEVVLKLDKTWKEEGASVQGAADPETARQYVLAKMDHMRGEGGGRGEGAGEGRGRHGKGEGRGKGERGGPGGRRPHPAFGVVTAVSADSITIKPEMPDFIKEQMEEREKMRAERKAKRAAEGGPEGGPGDGPGGKDDGDRERGGRPPRELPSELTFKLSEATIYVVNEDEQSKNPFKVGDRIAILPARPLGGPGMDGSGMGHPGMGGSSHPNQFEDQGEGRGGPGHAGPGHGGPGDDGPGMDGPPPPGGPGGDGRREMKAGVISDYASAEARMKEMREMMKEHREGKGGAGEGGQGRGEGRGRHHGAEGRDGSGKCDGQDGDN